MKNKVYLALGSNVGNRLKYIANALIEIQKLSASEITKISSFYLTSPYGNVNQDKFINICVELLTDFNPMELITKLQEIESKVGRIKRSKWEKREIDIDILFFNYEIIKTDTLTIPHYDLQNRIFFLKPLCELDENLIHPELNITVKELLNNFKNDLNIEILH